MARSEEVAQPRIFTREVDGKTKTRRVWSSEDQVKAEFDGYAEEAKPGKAAATTTTTSGAAK